MRRRLRKSARSGVARSFVGAAFAVLVTAGAALASPPAPAAAGQDSAVQGRRPLVRRPFQHQRHEELPCRGCHGSGAKHMTTRVRAPTDCAACHHDPARALACAKCHTGDGIPADRPVRLTLSLQVAKEPRVREVVFRHDVHLAPGTGVFCGDCHGTVVTLARNRECTTCHQSHHAGRARCDRCHAPPPERAHNESAHLGCAAQGCHATDRAPTPASSRELCLFCHAAQRTHEPDGTCAACHRIPGARAGGARAP